jgi:hypothetical protein
MTKLQNEKNVVLGREVKETVFCRATSCIQNKGRGKCMIVDLMNGDDKISVNSLGMCENFITE